MIDADRFNRQEERLRKIGVSVLIGVAAVAWVLVWLE